MPAPISALPAKTGIHRRYGARLLPELRKIKAAAGLFVLIAMTATAFAAPKPDCVKPAVILWGDGRHDDTVALNAWLRGENALWGDSGAPVGATIVGHNFDLSAPIYVGYGSGRMLQDFRLVWPNRGETVTGGTISAGRDPAKPPTVSGINIVGGDAGEGKPVEGPDSLSRIRKDDDNCGIS